MVYFIYFLIGIILLYLLGKFLAIPLKILWKLIVNGILGGVLLLIFNFFGSYFGMVLGINIVTCLIAGFFGIPGIIFMVVFKFII
ncbi:pro-sigmaK processing inhibitor BofA family protein [Clostridium sp. DL1XJH146]